MSRIGNILATTSMLNQWVPVLRTNLESVKSKPIDRGELAVAQEALRQVEDGLRTIDRLARRWAEEDLNR